jgi:DNA-binding transcriptional LysR family regulator
VELRQLRYFVAVAEELHFRRAAERLHMSQPPLSQQVQRLEAELGCRLLARDRRSVALTPAGDAFLVDVRGVLAALDRAVTTARGVAAGEEGRLRISFVGSALLAVVPEAVRALRAARPGIHVELRERPTEDQIRAVRAGDIDVGLVPLPIDADGVEATVLLREPTVAALPTGSALTRLQRVPLARLAAEPLVLFPREQAPGLHDRLLSSLSAAGTTPSVIQHATEIQTIVGLVAAGIGASLVQASVERLALPGVAYRRVANAPTVELAAIVRPLHGNPIIDAFVTTTRAALGRGSVGQPAST